MTEFKPILEAIVKFGVLPILLINVWWLNLELQDVKTKLYECFDDRETILKNKITNDENKDVSSKIIYYAVIPNTNNNKRKFKNYGIN